MTAPSQAEKDDALASAIAILRGMAAYDVEGVETLLSMVELLPVAATIAGICEQFGVVAYGSRERYADALSRWVPGGQLPTPDQL